MIPDNFTVSEALEEITNPAALPCQKHHCNWQSYPQKTENRNLNHYFTRCQYLQMIKALCPALTIYFIPVMSAQIKLNRGIWNIYSIHWSILFFFFFFPFCVVKCSLIKYWHCNVWASCDKHAGQCMLLPALHCWKQGIHTPKRALCLSTLTLCFCSGSQKLSR